MGLYHPKPTLNQLYAEQPELFRCLSIPAHLDRGLCANYIIQQLGELDTIFATPEELMGGISVWCGVNKKSWDEMWRALTASYDPISNYDRTDTETESISGAADSSFTGSTKSSGGDTTTRQRQGFDSQNFVDADKDISELGSRNDSDSSTESTSSSTRTKTLYSSGNIGVTTSQQMIEAELSLRKKTMYGIITESFKRELCVGVW